MDRQLGWESVVFGGSGGEFVVTADGGLGWFDWREEWCS